MAYGNEGMPWHPRKSAKAASITWKDAGYGNLTLLVLFLMVLFGGELRRSLWRRIAGATNQRPRR